MPTRCEAPAISIVRFELARSAMIRCASTGILRSWSPNTNQLGTTFHSGSRPNGSFRAACAIGRCVTASSFACWAGRSAQNC